MDKLNWLAMLTAGISAFILGGIWYSPALLGKPWMKETNLTEDDIRQSNKGKIFGWSLLLSLVMAVNLGMFLKSTPNLDLKTGLLFGLLAGLWIFCGIAIVGLFERRSGRYIFINGGYCLLALGIMGAILGAWR
ncbi:MAG: DUF1761 domain-containing protein [Flavisolibacter sp.]